MKARIILSVVGGSLVGLGASLLFAWLLFAGGPDAITPRQVDIRGVVLDETTRAPIPDARVKIASSMSRGASPSESRAVTRSDERGAFQVHMTIGGMTSFDVQKPGYLYASASRDPDEPVEVLLRSVPPDSGMKLCQGGVMHPKKDAVIRLECGRGVLAEGEVDEDIRLSRGPNSTLVIDAGPGRSIQWVASQESDSREWSGGPRNCCEAPADGYVASLSIPADAPRGLCFVRRDIRRQYGGFTIDPGVFTSRASWAVRYISVLNTSGGRGLCEEGKTAWAAYP